MHSQRGRWERVENSLIFIRKKCYNKLDLMHKGVDLSTLKERALKRKRIISLNKTTLHSNNHHSFHISLDDKSAWELLAKLSKEAWIEQTGKKPSDFVDKSVIKYIRF